MANMPMGPPVLPSYSLRVQLFAPNAHASGDRPIRCFRVVTSPELTIHEFCQEASRIHEINYGEPLAIKKVQDDQEFDITQSEVLGSLFTTTAIVRIIQASSGPGIRDSVPPSSALRFDPTNSINRKRQREGSARPNEPSPSNTYKPNKRQRLSDLDPDQPVPSRELETSKPALANGRRPESRVVPDSQRSTSTNRLNTTRHVRTCIPETPSPSPPPEVQSQNQNENGLFIHQPRKSLSPTLPEHSHLLAQANNSSPLRQASEKAQSNVANSSRSKSGSYHIQRATERGTSVSTAATSPLSGDQLPTQRPVDSANKRKASDPILPPLKVNGKQNSRSPNEDSVYENIESDGEGDAILRRKALKLKNSPSSGLPGLEWAKANKFNTPPNGSRRSSGSRDRREIVPSAGELPLTPASREREKSKQRQEAEEARKAQVAAAAAEEQRKKDAEKARQEDEEEDLRLAKVERAKREEDERLAVEEFNKEEEKRKATRLQREKEIKAEERRKQERVAKEKEEADRLEKVKAEAQRKRKEEEKTQQAKKAAAEQAKVVKKRASSESLNQGRNPSPASSQEALLSARRQQSSTPFMPLGKKSALKSSGLSQAAPTSSPEIRKTSPSLCKGGGIETQVPLTKDRRVSFNDEIQNIETPPKAQTSRMSTPKLSASKLSKVPPEKQSHTPILPPKTIGRPMKERSATPNTSSLVQTTIVTPRLGFTATPSVNKTTPQVVIKAKSPPTKITPARKSETHFKPRATKDNSKPKSISPAIVKPSTVDISSDESESEDGSGDDEDENEDVAKDRKPDAVESGSKAPPLTRISPPNVKLAPDREISNGDEESIEKTSKTTSPTRDSRSPVVFTRNPQRVGPEQSANPESKSPSDDDDEEESRATSEDVGRQPDHDDESRSEDDEEDDNEGSEIQVPKSSPPVLLPPKSKAIASTTTIPASSKLNSSQSKKMQHIATTSDDEGHTQYEVDLQLTSSMYSVPARAVSNTPVLPPARGTPIQVSKSSTPRPQMKIGASLSSLNAKKPVLGAASSQGSGMKTAVKRMDSDEEESEEEEESSDESSESSDEEEAKPAAQAVQVDPQPKVVESTSTSGTTSPTDSSSEADDDSASDSEEDSDPEKTRAKSALEAEIGSFVKSQSQTSTNGTSTSKVARSRSTQETKPTYVGKGSSQVKEKRKSDDKYLNSYQFSQPR